MYRYTYEDYLILARASGITPMDYPDWVIRKATASGTIPF